MTRLRKWFALLLFVAGLLGWHPLGRPAPVPSPAPRPVVGGSPPVAAPASPVPAVAAGRPSSCATSSGPLSTGGRGWLASCVVAGRLEVLGVFGTRAEARAAIAKRRAE